MYLTGFRVARLDRSLRAGSFLAPDKGVQT